MELSYTVVSHLLIRILGTEPNHITQEDYDNFPNIVVSHSHIGREPNHSARRLRQKTFQIILFLFLIFLFSYMERELNHSTGRLPENIPTTVVSHSHIRDNWR